MPSPCSILIPLIHPDRDDAGAHRSHRIAGGQELAAPAGQGQGPRRELRANKASGTAYRGPRGPSLPKAPAPNRKTTGPGCAALRHGGAIDEQGRSRLLLGEKVLGLVGEDRARLSFHAAASAFALRESRAARRPYARSERPEAVQARQGLGEVLRGRAERYSASTDASASVASASSSSSGVRPPAWRSRPRRNRRIQGLKGARGVRTAPCP